MAEFVLKDLVCRAGRSGEFEIASAAVSCEELGSPVYPPARRELAAHGISCAGKTARRITRADLDHYDYIYYMDTENIRYLRRLFGARRINAARCWTGMWRIPGTPGIFPKPGTIFSPAAPGFWRS